jgi:hypothetical protein
VSVRVTAEVGSGLAARFLIEDLEDALDLIRGLTKMKREGLKYLTHVVELGGLHAARSRSSARGSM